MLKENQLFDTVDKVAIAIERLKTFEPPEGYYLAFSGGKDSIVIKQLAIEAGVKFDAHYSVTTIDPPELVYFIRHHHKDIFWEFPQKPFLKRLPEKGFPLRQFRWCCAEYKERGGHERLVITGVRWAESHKRRNRRMIETCYRDKSKQYLNVIIDWSDTDVWDYIKIRKMPYCRLYDEGWKRLGCLFCPSARKAIRRMEAQRYPKHKEAFKRAFVELYRRRKEKGAKCIDRWGSGEEMFNYWLYEDYEKEDNEPTFFE